MVHFFLPMGVLLLEHHLFKALCFVHRVAFPCSSERSWHVWESLFLGPLVCLLVSGSVLHHTMQPSSPGCPASLNRGGVSSHLAFLDQQC